jgi:hypothetical protein
MKNMSWGKVLVPFGFDGVGNREKISKSPAIACRNTVREYWLGFSWSDVASAEAE